MILLDTHAFVWLASDPAKLSQGAGEAIRKSAKALMVSTVTAWEIALLQKRGRLILPLSAGDFFARALEHHGVHEVSLSRESILAAVALPDLHSDPFDRILVAESIQRKYAIVTKDQTISKYPGVSVIW